MALTAAFGSMLAENAVHARTVPRYSQNTASSIDADTGSTHQDVQIRAADGTDLKGWLFLPSHPHTNYAILLHGVGDTRGGMQRLIRMLLRHDYAVLAPDSRVNLVTYGILEAPDVHLWADYLYRTQPVQNLYGLGESMGAAVLLQSLPVEPRFRAIVAESPFSSFTAIARDRIQQNLNGDSWPVRALAVPVVSSGLLYTRLRYGVDLAAASPLDAIRRTSTPILLIHGLKDNNISPQHSRNLLLANPRHIVPWFVPKAGHSGAFSADPALFEERVVNFFESNRH
jgi:dipeptidyl aminopeptidase/acylaminoacyl peptidase